MLDFLDIFGVGYSFFIFSYSDYLLTLFFIAFGTADFGTVDFFPLESDLFVSSDLYFFTRGGFFTSFYKSSIFLYFSS